MRKSLALPHIFNYFLNRYYNNESINNLFLKGGIIINKECGYDDKTIYLCQSCQNDFLKFMENRKDK